LLCLEDGFTPSTVSIPLVTRLPMDLDLAAEVDCTFFQYRNPTIAARQTPTSAATALQAVATELDEPEVPAHKEERMKKNHGRKEFSLLFTTNIEFKSIDRDRFRIAVHSCTVESQNCLNAHL
jgi:hypothetical protein